MNNSAKSLQNLEISETPFSSPSFTSIVLSIPDWKMNANCSQNVRNDTYSIQVYIKIDADTKQIQLELTIPKTGWGNTQTNNHFIKIESYLYSNMQNIKRFVLRTKKSIDKAQNNICRNGGTILCI